MPPEIQKISVPAVPKLDAAFASWYEALDGITKLSALPPLNLSWDGGPPVLSLPPKAATERWFKLVTNSGGGAYTSAEVEPSASGGWAVVTGGLTPTLYEVNLYPSISLTGSVYVYAYRMLTLDEWRFQLGGC